MYECRNDMDILADLAERVGIENFNDKSELEWLREFTEGPVDDFDKFMEEGVARFPAPKDAVAFAEKIRDPAEPQIHNTVRQDRNLLDRGLARTQIRSGSERFLPFRNGCRISRPARLSRSAC